MSIGDGENNEAFLVASESRVPGLEGGQGSNSYAGQLIAHFVICAITYK